MTMPVMGDSTPRVKKAVEDAERMLLTDSHRYGYMISVAQGLELELAAAMEYGHKHRLEAALGRQNAEAERCPECGHGNRLNGRIVHGPKCSQFAAQHEESK